MGTPHQSANQLANTLNRKYDWESNWDQNIHQSLIGSSMFLGMAIGAFCGGKIIPFGRRLSMILTSLIGSAGVGLTMIQNFYVLLVGRVILGFTSGSQGVIVVRMINEYVPATY